MTPAQTSHPGLETLLAAIFQAWNRHSVAFLILRNYDSLPASTGNDVDVLVAPDQLKTAERLMVDAAQTCGYVLHNRVEFATLSCFFYHPDSLSQIQIDLFSRLKWHTFEFVSAREVLKYRADRGDFWIPHPAHEAVIDLVTRLIYQGNVKEKYRPVILKGFKEFPDEANKLLKSSFGGRLGSELVQLSLAERWEEIEGLWRQLQWRLVVRRLTGHPLSTAGALFGDALRLVRRWLHPGGLVVVVLGPDGSGKSTVSERVVQELGNTFNSGKMLHVHWKPAVLFPKRRKATGKPTVDPHGKPPRSRLISVCYLAGHWVEFFIGSHLLFRRATFKNGLVLVDRYYYDFLVDPRRYRLDVPKGIVRLLFKVIKRPDIVFLFDAPPEVLQARKQEVSFAETTRQAQAYRELVRALPQGCPLDATQPVADVAREMTMRILSYLRQRVSSGGHTSKSVES